MRGVCDLYRVATDLRNPPHASQCAFRLPEAAIGNEGLCWGNFASRKVSQVALLHSARGSVRGVLAPRLALIHFETYMQFDVDAWRRGNLLLLTLLAVFLAYSIVGALARDDGNWADKPRHVRDWFNSLRQPDTQISCCGPADAVEADQYEVHPDGSVTAMVTGGRGYVPDGTVVHVPPGKVVVGRENPTGHSILFLSLSKQVWCFVPNGGV